MRNAAEELRTCFVEPAEGEMTQRLSNALDRYLSYVDEHDAAYSALLRGGSVAETSRTDAIVDGVRRGAAEQILMHLGAPHPGPRLAMMVRSWIASVEAVSLTWLDEGKQPPPRSCGGGWWTTSSRCCWSAPPPTRRPPRSRWPPWNRRARAAPPGTWPAG